MRDALPVTAEEVAAYREECLARIDDARLRDEYLDAHRPIAFWRERAALAQEAFALAKLRAEREIAALREKAVTDLSARGLKCTEDAIAARVAQYPTYREVGEGVARAEYVKNSAWGMVEAVVKRAEMIINFGAHARTELRADGRTL